MIDTFSKEKVVVEALIEWVRSMPFLMELVFVAKQSKLFQGTTMKPLHLIQLLNQHTNHLHQLTIPLQLTIIHQLNILQQHSILLLLLSQYTILQLDLNQ